MIFFGKLSCRKIRKPRRNRSRSVPGAQWNFSRYQGRTGRFHDQ